MSWRTPASVALPRSCPSRRRPARSAVRTDAAVLGVDVRLDAFEGERVEGPLDEQAHRPRRQPLPAEGRVDRPGEDAHAGVLHADVHGAGGASAPLDQVGDLGPVRPLGAGPFDPVAMLVR